MKAVGSSHLVLDVDTRIYPEGVVENALAAFRGALEVSRVEHDGWWIRIHAMSHLDVKAVRGEFGNYMIYAFVTSRAQG
jgi:hypothetical protein